MGSAAASVLVMEEAPAVRPQDREAEGRRWIAALRATGPEREVAAATLHAMLLRAARFELARRRGLLAGNARETRQREVLGALVLDDVPIDVLADRLGTTRGALYKTLHDARRKLRTAVGAET
jgi:DNA-directed RNA polymerase specialized sigma24 family protein